MSGDEYYLVKVYRPHNFSPKEMKKYLEDAIHSWCWGQGQGHPLQLDEGDRNIKVKRLTDFVK